MKYLLIIMICAGLVGCPAPYINGQPNENSVYFEIPAGSRLILEKPLQVPAERNKLYFQNGRALDWAAVNIYLPYCALTMTSKNAEAQPVQPDDFAIREIRTEHFFNIVRDDQTPDIRPAALVTGPLVDMDQDHGGRTYEVVGVVMALESEHQPNVKAMICADWGVPQGTQFITVAKIRKSLGSFFELVLNLPAS
ncbi:MAG: hypothetical protein M0036_26960 [Desulfobacteraceae bacterium]|nr:hypothetical protein [Desulfobacteraceae bacterium]